MEPERFEQFMLETAALRREVAKVIVQLRSDIPMEREVMAARLEAAMEEVR